MSAPASLDAFFAPESISIVGVSSQPESFSRRTLGYLKTYGYPGRLTAVNPAMTEVDGVSCLPSLRDVAGPVDLALVFTAAGRVESVIDDAVASGAKAAVIFSSGFAELGTEGRALQDRVRRLAVAGGMRLLGPNCQGVMHVRHRTIATFTGAAAGLADAVVGPVAYVGQSGAVGGALFDLMRSRGLAPAAWVSAGNQIDVSVTEAARHLVDDDSIETLLVYLEQLPPGDHWGELCVAAERAGKQLVALQTGRTPAGQRAAASHTGALVGENRAFELLSEQHGVVLARDLRQMMDIALGRRGGAHRGGRRLGVVTTSGGAGGLAADGCASRGLQMAELSPETRNRLDAMLAVFASSANPVDVTAQFTRESIHRTGELCQIVAADPSVDHTLIVFTNLAGANADAIATSLIESVPGMSTPFSLVFLAASDRTVSARRMLAEAGVPVFEMVSDALDVIATLSHPSVSSDGWSEHDLRRGDERAEPVGDPIELRTRVLTEHDGASLLDEAGLGRPRSVLAHSASEASAAAVELGGHVVLKVQSSDVLHKTEVGGVRIGVAADVASDAYEEMCAHVSARLPGARITGILVQELVPVRVELLVGVQGGRDGYEPVVTVALGGVLAEIYRDAVSCIGAVDAVKAHTLMRGLRGWPLLAGYRGGPQLDVDAAAQAIAGIVSIAHGFGQQLIELEVNPLGVCEAGAYVLDFVARIRPD